MNISQYPNPEQIAALVTSTETGPVVMVNLLKFKARADAPHVGISGMEALPMRGCRKSQSTGQPDSRVNGSSPQRPLIRSEAKPFYDDLIRRARRLPAVPSISLCSGFGIIGS